MVRPGHIRHVPKPPHPHRSGHFGEEIFLVAIQQQRRQRPVSHAQIQISVVVVIAPGHTPAISLIRHTVHWGHIQESATVIPIEPIGLIRVDYIQI